MFLKNKFLNTSAILFAPPNDDGSKTAAELEREQIEVQELPKKEADEKIEVDEEDQEQDIEVEKEETVEEVIAETPEQKVIREADEAANADTKTKRQIERMQKRIDTLTAKTRNTEAEKAELQKLLDAKKEDGSLTLTEDEVERRAELKAEQKVNEREFKKAVNALASGANKLDPDNFNKNIKNITDEIGLLPPVMIGILDDLENEAGKKVGSEVLVYLSKNIDDYEYIFPLSEGRMALKLKTLADKITKKKVQPVSQVPKPNEPVGGNRVATQLNDKMTDAEWIAKREADLKAKRSA